MKAAIYTLYAFFALIVLVVGFAVLDYCGGAGVGFTSSAFFASVRAVWIGALNLVEAVCTVAAAFCLGFVILLPATFVGCLALALMKRRQR
jgi:hypothetical protein